MQITNQTLARAANQHKAIKEYIDDLPPKAIYNRIQANEYSIHETIAYLTRYHHVFLERLNCIKNEVNPFFDVYKPDEDSIFSFTNAKTTGSLLHELYRLRHEICQFLETLEPADWKRAGTHSALGRMDIGQWLEFFLLHESSQLFKIFRMSGSFWTTEFSLESNIIHLPRMNNQLSEMAG